jgi:NAD(P)-dependent dehydrogenase (short-subunit alcohol dehydrogenase family)
LGAQAVTHNKKDTLAVVIGGGGSIGGALVKELRSSKEFYDVVVCGRSSKIELDLFSEDSITNAATSVSSMKIPISMVALCTGVLHSEVITPEKTWRRVEAQSLETIFHVNAIGPMLVMKHFLPLLAKVGTSVFACLSARVGSIGDNGLGGWYGYRASKAALNQFVKTASVELSRTRPEAACIAIHPGTVATSLSRPFSKTGLDVMTPEQCARKLHKVLNEALPQDSGGFFYYEKRRIPW